MTFVPMTLNLSRFSFCQVPFGIRWLCHQDQREWIGLTSWFHVNYRLNQDSVDHFVGGMDKHASVGKGPAPHPSDHWTLSDSSVLHQHCWMQPWGLWRISIAKGRLFQIPLGTTAVWRIFICALPYPDSSCLENSFTLIIELPSQEEKGREAHLLTSNDHCILS